MRASILVVALVFPSLAQAQSVAEPKSWTATPFLGLSLGISDGLTSSIGLGGAVGYDFTANLGVEGELGHAFDVAGNTDLIDWSLTNISVNAVYHFDVVRFTPYATFGLGVERSSLSVDVGAPQEIAVIPSSTEIAYNFGGGIKYKIGDRMLGRADLRRFQANDSAPDHWRMYAGLTFVLRR